LPPLGLYVHLPWCVRKCPYCDFNSHQLQGAVPAADYCEALLDDLREDLPLVWGRPVASVFFGGGTPSLFSGDHIGALLSRFRALLRLAPAAEITLEANPGTIERDSFMAYAQAGINRISLGVQSFDDGLLKAIGRIHGRQEVAQSLEALRASPISNFNIDLMYGLPGQSLAQAVDDVDRAIAAGATHISHYQLTLEPNTLFAAQPPKLPPDELCWDMQEATAGRLAGAGYRQYEISAWCKPGRECQHNLNYWRFGDYLGIGAGAHAKLTQPAAGEVLRQAKVRHPRRYLAGERLAVQQAVAAGDLVFEYFLNALRLREGPRQADFEARTGLAWAALAPRLDDAVARGLLEPVAGGVRPSALGWRFVNDLQALFLPGTAADIA
jgi:oxygen-independent coproporphyrinogen-3 oxidase